jgi:hypothetical protein
MKTFYIVEACPGYEAGQRVIVDENGLTVCAGPMGEDNAQLIAAAPMMLRALERMLHPMADDDDVDFAQSIVDLIRGPT